MPVSSIFRPKRLASLYIAAILSLGFGAASAQTLGVPHAQGIIQLPSKPEKVLTFDLGTLDILDALGVPVAGVPKFSLPSYLSKYEQGSVEKIGTLFEPDYEAVNAARPDLIVVGDRSRTKYQELSKIAPTIDLSVDQKDYLGSVIKNTRLLAGIFGKEAEAEARIARIEAALSSLRPLGARAGKGLIVLTTGGKMSVYGPGSRFGLIHDVVGIKPAAEGLAVATHGQAINAEFVLRSNPDWLFVLDRDAAVGQGAGSAQRILDNDLVAQTTAWKKGQVVYLDPVNWYLMGGGLQALQANIDQIAQAIGKP
ncbi:siderophore ABC transporter substrate-binding protein [Microvirga sp. ACRRW]|uniref:siderophore ABC transporter substrate-binding protein n=1 Tax=Microvirga sp. ACRRW TaxID=2918205 RepID=UPI001EF6EE7F|nr:siderophore ABC transporter substrate-binding protein [Microvirga sp. ACRRW]MCG7392846.1 siderophore ABC transporter substrate-binding protein [Microvirga sp. ACRRW]